MHAIDENELGRKIGQIRYIHQPIQTKLLEKLQHFGKSNCLPGTAICCSFIRVSAYLSDSELSFIHI